MWNATLRLARSLGFTRGETGAILFLVTATLAGGIIRAFGTGDAPPPGTLAESYRAHDSAFAAAAAGLGTPSLDTLDALPVHEGGSAPGTTDARAGTQGPGKEAILAGMQIDINRAGVDQLMSLPGVGQATARNIVEYRAQNGPFRRIDDIMQVKGIGEKKFERMKPYICVLE